MPSYPAGSPPDDADIWDHAHRPWPVPTRPWVGFMTWLDLLFAHWPIRPELLRDRIPPQLVIDTFDGSGWIGIVPFTMSNARPRFSPVALNDFPELNVRTYVKYGGKPGIYFFSLDAASSLLVWGARQFVSLPYYNATMRVIDDARGWTRYRSARTHRGAPPARWVARYRPTGKAAPPDPGTLEHFLTERYCLYTLDGASRPRRLEIHHRPWPLQAAEAQISINTMAEAAGFRLPSIAPLLHFAKRQDMVAFPMEEI